MKRRVISGLGHEGFVWSIQVSLRYTWKLTGFAIQVLRAINGGDLMRWLMKRTWGSMVLLLLLGCTREPTVVEEDADSRTGEIVGVYDGDTCTLLVGQEKYKIRLEGIDTPEMGQAFGKRAKQALASYIFGKQVTARFSGQDRYQRYLGTILLDGQNVNLQMVKDGCAWHYKQYSSDAALAQAESAARSAGRGLWADADAMAPWEWRRKGPGNRATGTTATVEQGPREIPDDAMHWLNTSSGIRHNRNCRQFGKSKAGRVCESQEGRACKICGG